MTPGRLLYWLTFIQPRSIRCHADSVSTHQALGCELGHLVDHTVGKVQHTYTGINTQGTDSQFTQHGLLFNSAAASFTPESPVVALLLRRHLCHLHLNTLLSYSKCSNTKCIFKRYSQWKWFKLL